MLGPLSTSKVLSTCKPCDSDSTETFFLAFAAETLTRVDTLEANLGGAVFGVGLDDCPSVCAAAHMEESGSESTTSVAVSEDIPSKFTAFSIDAKMA